MLSIRLARTGRKNVKVFRIIVSEKTKHPKRGSLDILGYYNPETNPYTLEFDQEKLEKYLKNGAVPSETVARLLNKAGVKSIAKYVDSKKSYSCTTKDKEKLAAIEKEKEEAKAAAEAAKAPKVEEAPAEEAETEAPAEETKAE